MMLLQQLKSDLTAARKNKEQNKVILLSTVLGELDRKNVEITDNLVISTIKKMIQDNDETSKYCLKEHLAEENVTLRSYLPKTLSVDEILTHLSEIRDELSNSLNNGAAIGRAIKYLKGKNLIVDSKDVVSVIELLRK